MSCHRFLSVCLLLVAAAGVSSLASAATVTWDPGLSGLSDGSGTWSIATANWWNGNAPDALWSTSGTDTAVFGNGNAGTYPVTVSGTVGVGGITFNPGTNYNISGGTIALDGASAPFITMNATSGTIGSILAGSAGLQTVGSGTLFVTNAANSFTGGVYLDGGVLDFTSGALNTTSNIIQFNSGTLQWATGNTQDISGKIGISASTQTAYLDTNGNANINFVSTITGSGGLTKLGAGQLTFSAAENYSGTTTVSAGTLVLNANAGPNGTLPNSAIVIAAGGEIDLGASDYTGYSNSNPMTIYGTLKKIGNQSETLYRPITLSGGTLTSTLATSSTGNGAGISSATTLPPRRVRPTTSKVMGRSRCAATATSISAPTAR